MSNVISAERFFSERQLKQVLQEMEAECVSNREAILKNSIKETEGAAILSRLYDNYMRQLIETVRYQRGGLLPYHVKYFIADTDRPSPTAPHELVICYRDLTTEEDIALVQFAVVFLPNDGSQPLPTEISDAAREEMSEALNHLNTLYFQYLIETQLEKSEVAGMFYLPFLAAITSCFGFSAEEVIESPVPIACAETDLSEEDRFYPYEFHFETDSDDPRQHVMAIRMAQNKPGAYTMAVEAVFNLQAVKDAVAREEAYKQSTPPTQSIH